MPYNINWDQQGTLAPTSSLPSLKQHPGFLDQGGTGRTIAGYIGDALSRMAGGPSIYQQTVLDAQKQKRETESVLQRVILEAQARAAFPKAQEPTTTQRTYEYLKSIRPDLAETYLSNQSQGAPIAVDSMDEAGNTHREYLRPGSLGQGQPAQTPGNNTGTLPPGYAVRKRGGAAPTASAPFPLRPLTR